MHVYVSVKGKGTYMYMPDMRMHALMNWVGPANLIVERRVMASQGQKQLLPA